ncbi:MAG: hypothetical protein ATN33_08075 [Epulopiscium sp. Nele67-Bin001]|nr:MAG: hypothetical protein ATN33_08075 [Epulopiscium sp. Nele67-Bin001]
MKKLGKYLGFILASFIPCVTYGSLNMEVYDIILTQELMTIEVIANNDYTAYVTYTDQPSSSMQYLLVYVGVSTADGLDIIYDYDISLHFNGNIYYPVQNDFLDDHHYKKFDRYNGYVVFEVPHSFNLEAAYLRFRDIVEVDITTKNIWMQYNHQNLVDAQDEMKQLLLAGYNANDYIVSDDILILIDPYEWCPLSALAVFETKAKAKITTTVRGKDLDCNVCYSVDEFNTHHEVPIIGLYDNAINVVDIMVEYKVGIVEIYTININLGSVTYNIGQFEPANSRLITPDINLYGQALGSAVAVDCTGKVRWFLNHDYIEVVEYLSNGNVILRDTRVGDAHLFEIDMVGKVYTN